MKVWFQEKRKLIKGILIGMILLLLVFCCITKQDVSTHYSKVNAGKSIEEVPLLDGHEIVQPLMFTQTDIRSVGIALTGFDENIKGDLGLILTDESNDIIFQRFEPINDFEPKTVKWIRIDTKVNVQKQYYLHFVVRDLQGNVNIAAVSTEKAIEECNQGLLFDGSQSEGRIVVNVAYRLGISNIDRLRLMVYAILLILIIIFIEKLIPYRFYVISGLLALVILDMSYTSILKLDTVINRNLFFFIAIVFLIGIALQVMLYLHGERRHERFFVILMLMWGIIYSATLPPVMAPDEDVHYAAAYKLSNAMMGSPLSDTDGRAYIRETDDYVYDRNSYSGYIQEIYEKIDDKAPEENNYITYSGAERVLNIDSPVYNFLPQAIGITIARILHLNSFWLVYMGRLMNLLVYTLIMYYAIKITPFGKLFLVNVSQIPIVVENVSSYSYDVLVLSTCALFVAYILRIIYDKEKAEKKDIAIIILLSAVIATLKFLYTPIVVLALWIPVDKLGGNKKRSFLLKVGILFIAAISFVLVYRVGFLNMRSIQPQEEHSVYDIGEQNEIEQINEEDIIFEDTDAIEDMSDNYLIDQGEYERYTLAYFKENSFRACKKIAYTLGKYLEDYFSWAFGYMLARHNVFTPKYTLVFLVIWFLISLVCEDKQRISVGVSYTALGIFLIFCAAIVLGAMTQWNAPEQFQYIYGVQGRYFIPLLPLFIPMIRKVQFFKKDYMERYFVMVNIIQLLTVMFICLYIWEK